MTAVVRAGLAGLTVSVIRVDLIRDPFVPVTLRLKVPANGPGLMVSAVEFPWGVNLTLTYWS